jgi:hypothetical protein
MSVDQRDYDHLLNCYSSDLARFVNNFNAACLLLYKYSPTTQAYPYPRLEDVLHQIEVKVIQPLVKEISELKNKEVDVAIHSHPHSDAPLRPGAVQCADAPSGGSAGDRPIQHRGSGQDIEDREQRSQCGHQGCNCHKQVNNNPQPEMETTAQMKEFDDLTAQVNQTTTVEASAVLLINGIAAKLAALVESGTVDPAAVSALSSQLKASADAMSAAIAANTQSSASPSSVQ